jgi:hypothetical protein
MLISTKVAQVEDALPLVCARCRGIYNEGSCEAPGSLFWLKGRCLQLKPHPRDLLQNAGCPVLLLGLRLQCEERPTASKAAR